MGYGDLTTDQASKLFVSIRKRHSADETLPRGAILMTKQEVLNIQVQIVEKWTPKFEM